MVGVCCVAPGQTVIRNYWNLRFLSFSCSNRLRGKTEGGKTGSLININILMCEGGREDLSGLAAFIPCCGAFLSLFPSLSCSLSSLPSFSSISVTGIFSFSENLCRDTETIAFLQDSLGEDIY